MQQEINYLQQLLATLRTRLLVMAASVGIALEKRAKPMGRQRPWQGHGSYGKRRGHRCPGKRN